ncbi:MAG: hypothetical protein IJS95_03110 [Prevotella sp.]|nr:hypothetical protein [Prevotella sp.]
MIVLPPGTGVLAIVIAIAWLMGNKLKSVGRKLDTVSRTEVPDLDEIKRQLGPMTWKEHVVGVLMIIAFVAIVGWLAWVTT